MAVVTGRDVVVDPRVKGTINLQTDRADLAGRGLQPVRRGAAAAGLRGRAVRRALQGGAGSRRQAAEQHRDHLDARPPRSLSGNQIVTQVFKLNYESANNLLPVLRPLIAPNNTINVNPGNNSLVITDYAENMRRLARIIAALDVPNASDVEVIPLKHSIATDLVPLVHAPGRRRQPGAPGAPRAAPGAADASFRTTLLAEPRSNAIILRAANPARAQLVRTLVDKLDRAAVDSGNGAAGNVYVVYLKNADAVRLAATLRAAISAEARGGSGAGGRGAPGATGSQPDAQQLSSARQLGHVADQPGGHRAAQQRQPALDRRPDPGRPVDQLADHHGAPSRSTGSCAP